MLAPRLDKSDPKLKEEQERKKLLQKTAPKRKRAADGKVLQYVTLLASAHESEVSQAGHHDPTYARRVLISARTCAYMQFLRTHTQEKRLNESIEGFEEQLKKGA